MTSLFSSKCSNGLLNSLRGKPKSLHWLQVLSSVTTCTPLLHTSFWSSLRWGLLCKAETDWDMGPETLCCCACTWTNILSSNKIQRNYKGLKITACMCSEGKLWTIRYKKTKKPTATSEKPGAKAVYCECPVHITPPKAWANYLSHPPGPIPGHTTTLTPYKESARPHWASEKGNLLLVLAPPCCSRVPNKALPEFLVWSLINFYWLRRPRTLVGNKAIPGHPVVNNLSNFFHIPLPYFIFIFNTYH